MDESGMEIWGGTVLVLDGEPATRARARIALQEAGFSVAESDDGGEALELFEKVAPDIVILDVLLPGLDGLTVCRQIREHPEGWNTPILMMVEIDDVQSIQKAYRIGATDFITKTTDFRVLSYRVRYMLRASQTLQELSRSRASLNQAERLAQLGSWEWDVRNDVLHWSESIFRIFGVDPAGFDRSYHSFLNAIHPRDREAVDAALEKALRGSKYFSLDHEIVVSDGSIRHVHTEATVIDDRTGSPVLVTGTVQDITEWKEYEDRIRTLAYFDSLTGLPNRLLFKENLARVLGEAEESGGKAAVMFLDMDHFKEINDTMGHDLGDALLQAFAERLTGCVRTIERESGAASGPSRWGVARLGGDEFTVVLDRLAKSEDAADVAQRIVDAMAAQFEIDGRRISVTVSIGISIYPEDGADTVTLLKNADIAMYQAKYRGRNMYAMNSAAPPPGAPGSAPTFEVNSPSF